MVLNTVFKVVPACTPGSPTGAPKRAHAIQFRAGRLVLVRATPYRTVTCHSYRWLPTQCMAARSNGDNANVTIHPMIGAEEGLKADHPVAVRLDERELLKALTTYTRSTGPHWQLLLSNLLVRHCERFETSSRRTFSRASLI